VVGAWDLRVGGVEPDANEDDGEQKEKNHHVVGHKEPQRKHHLFGVWGFAFTG
jgi:hypothetical protein